MKTVTKFCIVTLLVLMSGCAVTQPTTTQAPTQGIEQIMAIAERCPGLVAVAAGVTEEQYKAIVKCQWSAPVNPELF